MKNLWKKFKEENRCLVKPFLVLVIIYMVGILAILFAGVHYADDVARTNYGYAGWSGFSRYLSTILAHGISANGYLTNLAPLPQIIAVVVLAMASLIMIVVISGKEVFREKWSKWILRIIAVVPLALSPYMLECLSYQYDAPYMAISVLAAVASLLFWKSEKWWIYVGASVAGVLVACMTYQAAIQIFPMLVILVAMKWWNEKKDRREIAKFLGISVVTFLATVVIFEKFLMIPRDAYASNSLPEMQNFLGDFFAHIRQYFELVVSDFKVSWLVLIGLILLTFVVVFALRSKRNKILASIVSIAGLAVMALMCFAMYSALDKPLYAMRAMYPVGAFIAAIGIYNVSFARKTDYKKILVAVPIIVLSWCFFVFAFSYGNVLREQNAYRNDVVRMVIDDLNEIMGENETITKDSKIIQTSGNVGMTPVVLNMPDEEKRIYSRLLAPSFSEYVPWMAYKLLYQSGLGIYYYSEVDLTNESLPILKKTALYNIYGNEKGILVKFKGDKGLEVLF